MPNPGRPSRRAALHDLNLLPRTRDGPYTPAAPYMLVQMRRLAVTGVAARGRWKSDETGSPMGWYPRLRWRV
jgi:hypothetical protein